jgi:DNA segregation ATPase FtsK/SpoIIIE-like protein
VEEVPDGSDFPAAGHEEPALAYDEPSDDGDEAGYFAVSSDEPPEVEPVVEVAHAVPDSELRSQNESEVAAADVEAVEEAVAETAAMATEPVIAIPRPPEGVRQQRLFVGVVDDSLVRDAIDVVTQSRRASATHLQRKLRVDYEQALELLQVLAHRGVIELVEGESQGRVR